MLGEQKFQGIGMTSDRTRQRLIRQLSEAGIDEPHVLAAMSEIPRHLFVEEGIAHRAYENNALPIGLGQTISQPYIVAQMTQILWRRSKHQKLLEIGTGSGYQCAILSRLWDEVYTIERIRELQLNARERLLSLGLRNIHYKAADGYLGWKEHAPFDAIIVTAAAPVIPERLLAQLSDEGVMIIPIGAAEQIQQLILIEKVQGEIKQTEIEPVRFVPMLPGIQT
ncbi:MAG TPA: protein-L-isoaspartate(D-aspartate) O-methyltransferase [Aeromonadales bacterium]|nr:protein-L-isoaspartate(D-aspartate) O-methyltransferase [Aeromonadales bacterium]